MNRQFFNEKMIKLNDFYPKFTLTDSQLEAWYGFFKNYTEKQFSQMCYLFSMNSEFPPQSPVSLKKYLDQQEEQEIQNNSQSADEAWQLVRNTNKACGIGSKMFYDRVSKVNPIAAKVSEGFVNELKPPATSQQWDITSHAWKKAYDIEVKRVISNKQLGLDSTEYQRLLKGNLMIESSDKNEN